MIIPDLLRHTSKRTTYLSEGIKLCGFTLAICAAPLPFVASWVATWLLIIITIVALGTFGVWATNAIKNKNHYPSEEHTEKMAELALIGQNRDGKQPLIQAIEQTLLSQNPNVSDAKQEASDGQV